MPQALPTFEDVLAAAARLEGVAHKTPVLRSRTLDHRMQAQVFVKCENFQRMGAFKFRGGFNALAKLSETQRRAGVVAYSSGNHAQAVALSAQILQIPATIFMPHDASAAKLAATQGYGAKVIGYDRYSEDASVLATELARSKGLTFIPPFDHPDVLSGQGTAALELFKEVGPLDALFVCLGRDGGNR
jgi:threonine dehydratase